MTQVAKFQRGDRVRKIKGSSWTGRVCGIYSTALTPLGYAVESENEPGSVQIYPEAALEPAPAPARELVESRRLTSEDVEWVVNDIAELGVKIGDQFFFLYKGKSLVYGELDPDPSIPPVHEDGSPMHWRHVFKREFGECAHPINYGDLTKIGTVSLDDSDEWQPLPAALAKQGGQ